MSGIGNRIFTRINRPNKALLEELKKIPVANLDDNMGRIYAVDAAIKPYNSLPLCGPAFTVKAPAGDNLMFHRALELAEEGDIIVVSGIGGAERSYCGEIMMTYAEMRKLGGLVIDGYIRDLDCYKNVKFPVYARGIQPNGPYKYGPGEINVPVACGGQAVLPGDILVGDSDGLVVIPGVDAEDVLAKGKATLAKETEMLRRYRSGENSAGPRKWVTDTLTAIKTEIFD